MMHKLPHMPIYKAIVAALHEIFFEQRYADKVIEKYLKTEKKWGSRDRRQFAEATYDIVRWWRRLACTAKAEFKDGHLQQPSDIPFIVNIYFENFSEDAAENELAWVERQSIPDWLDEVGRTEIGSRWSAFIENSNKRASVYLRVNSLKGNRDELVRRLSEDEIEAEVDSEVISAVKLKKRANVFRSVAFKDGLFEVQDSASQLVAPFLDPQPGERIADACAGAGGKSLHIATLMKNKGKVLAMDVHQWKLDNLRERASRNGVDIIECRLIESSKTVKRLEGQFDRVLLDVPCSGIGVLRRNPDTKWKLTAEELSRLQQVQSEILASYSRLVRPGGTLVYATCSVFPSENEAQVQKFLKTAADKFNLVAELKTSPEKGEFDGFYAAKMLRLS